MKRFLVLTFLLVSCGSGPSQVPCTACPDVAGSYVETSAMTSVTCMAGDMLTWRGGSDNVTLEQDGSTLTLNNGLGSVVGTLHDDLSVAFEPVAAVAVSSDGSGSEPGELYIVGQFSAVTPPSFDATYTFVRTSDQCRINATAAWTPN